MAEPGSPERISSSSESGSPRKSPRRSWKTKARGLLSGPSMTKFPTFVDEVLEMNKSQRLWPSAKELVTNLHLKLSSANNELIQQLMVAQYQIAKVNRKIA